MRFWRGILLVPVVLALGAGSLAGCAAAGTTTRTVVVTETASASGTETGSTDAGTSTSTEASPSASSETSTPSETTESTPSVTAAPFVPIDALKVDCAKVMNGTQLAAVFGGGLPGGTARVVEAANPDRGITGRIKCQYGMAADKSIIAVTIIFAQFTSAEAADSQIDLTVEAEKNAGATTSSTFVQGYPAEIMLRQGGLLVMNYDTWNLSVVIADNVIDTAQLPQALTAVADYALTRAVS